MFCTGGIRCEKATALLKAEGIEQVHHLQGGILKYLEEVPAAESRWHGECFVFDERVAVGHGLAPGTHELCRGCRMPVSPADRASPLYEEGVSCPACHGTRDDAARARLCRTPPPGGARQGARPSACRRNTPEKHALAAS